MMAFIDFAALFCVNFYSRWDWFCSIRFIKNTFNEFYYFWMNLETRWFVFFVNFFLNSSWLLLWHIWVSVTVWTFIHLHFSYFDHYIWNGFSSKLYLKFYNRLCSTVNFHFHLWIYDINVFLFVFYSYPFVRFPFIFFIPLYKKSGKA